MQASDVKADYDDRLIKDIVTFRHDPLGFVLYAFDWGKGELKGKDGPRPWQRDVLTELGDALKAGVGISDALPILIARASGHGIGKSALVSWIVLWALSTLEDTKCTITANTETQLRTKTWPEIAKWVRLSVNSHWFNVTATAIFSKDKGRGDTWRADAATWSKNNTEAFAGLHNEGKRIVLIFDEASAIDDLVWEVAEGALTDENTEIMWLAFGNPTRNTGRFREAFGKLSHRWRNKQVDSRTVEGTNKAQIQQWVDDYGEDSDFVRVRVRGMFPRAGSMQLIPSDAILQATKIDAQSSMYDPLIMGVDIARFGDDKTVIRFRRGRDGRSIPPIKLRNVDTMSVAGRVDALIKQYGPDAVFVDEGGVGAGVVDRLRQLGHDMIWAIQFGAKADGEVGQDKCANKAAEMYCRMRDWLKTGGAIDADPELIGDLEAREYGYNARDEIQLEKKEEMKKRGLHSPDDGDGLALTFAQNVAKRPPEMSRLRTMQERMNGGVGRGDYDPYAGM